MKDDKPRSETRQAPPAPPSAAPTGGSGDIALIHGVSPDGAVKVIRRRGDRLEAGALTPLREGAPIHGEVVSLRPRENCPLLCDVDVLYTPPEPAVVAKAKPAARPAQRRKGPAQVATDSYRDNWDSIWSRKKSDALN
jgi:hypothetical protein